MLRSSSASFKNSYFPIHHRLFLNFRILTSPLKTLSFVRGYNRYLLPRSGKRHKPRRAWCEAENTNTVRSRRGADRRARHQTGIPILLSFSWLPHLDTFAKSIARPTPLFPKYSRWLQCSVSNQMLGRDQDGAQSIWVFKKRNTEHVRGLGEHGEERLLRVFTRTF